MRFYFPLFALAMLAYPASAQEWQMVYTGEAPTPFRVEQINPAAAQAVSTFENGIAKLRELEGISASAKATIMQNPKAPIPAVLCSFPNGAVWLCDESGGMTLK